MNPSHDGNESGLRSYDMVGGLAQGGTAVVRANYFVRYAKGFRQTFYHEMAHILEARTFDNKQKQNLIKLYKAAKLKKSFLNEYSSINESEYFAEAVEAFASETKNAKYVWPDEVDMTKVNLQTKDPDLYQFILTLIKN